MTRCRKCGWYYKSISDWLQHQYGHRDGRKPRYGSKKPNNFQKTTRRNDRAKNS